MLKKIILTSVMAIALVISIPTKAHAAYGDGAAIGAAFVGGFPAHTGLALTGQFSGVPLMFGLGFRAEFNDSYQYFGLGFTMDWWGLKIPLLQDNVGIHFYLGPGLGVDATFGSEYWRLHAGLRVPIGFSFVFAKSWEIFLELAPTLNVLSAGSHGFQLLGIYVGDGGGGFGLDGLLAFGAQLGFRYWF
ncbi:hypothetical protein [Brachyspira sp.]|uniref:hypothetical protein n=1 Tax=Brachyspira sp. TaxID=1977261 RepID=UPI002629E0D0|nr:hypothetical protein [Brachyspira sp.]